MSGGAAAELQACASRAGLAALLRTQREVSVRSGSTVFACEVSAMPQVQLHQALATIRWLASPSRLGRATHAPAPPPAPPCLTMVSTLHKLDGKQVAEAGGAHTRGWLSRWVSHAAVLARPTPLTGASGGFGDKSSRQPLPGSEAQGWWRVQA